MANFLPHFDEDQFYNNAWEIVALSTEAFPPEQEIWAAFPALPWSSLLFLSLIPSLLSVVRLE